MVREPDASLLEQLLAAGGSDSGLHRVTEEVWRDFVERTAETLDVGPGTSVFDIGCGSGAFLLPLYQNDYTVGGLDRSAALIHQAADAMPSGQWLQGEASTLDPGEPWDVVLACGTFGLFPNLDYARGVLARMVAKATHAIAILDVPDADTKDDTAVDGLFYDRAWMLRALAEIGVKAVQIEDQRVDDYQHARFRFNVFARL